MYENVLLESGKVFRGSWLSGVGGKVVDDSETITILVTGEGDAEIISVSVPDRFTPGVEFTVEIQVKNNGFGDDIFARLTNTDTDDILEERYVEIGGNGTRTFTFPITLSQTTDFHGLVEVGHMTGVYD